MNKYLYSCREDGKLLFLQVIANKRPSEKNIPRRRGAWSLREYSDGQFRMPCFPEITWGTLKKMNYIGKLKEE